jgi:hypothetical protein
VIERLGEIGDDLEPALDELAPTLHDLRPILHDATPVVRQALPLVTGLGTLLDRTASAAPEFKTLMELLRSAGVLLDTSVLPAFHRESQVGIPTYLQLVAAFTAGTGAERPYQTIAQNPNGAGHVIRLGFGGNSSFLTSTFLPACPVIAAVNPTVAAQLEAAGLCQP